MLTTGAHSLDGLVWHMANLGIDFEVLEPAELAAHVKSIGERLTRAARKRL